MFLDLGKNLGTVFVNISNNTKSFTEKIIHQKYAQFL
jgi:hypothetical protein